MKATDNSIWHIAGIGALGSLVAGSFYQNKLPVRLIFKNSQQLSAYHHVGLTILNDLTDLSVCPNAIDLDHLDHQPIDQLICCLKAYDVTPLLIRLKEHLNKNSIIILIHNGVGVLEEIQNQLPQLRIICGISSVGAYLEKPFKVKPFLNGKFYLGPAIGQFTVSEINTVCNSFKQSILPFQWVDGIQLIIWEKFAINCCINLLTALFKCKNGQLLSHEGILKELVSEVSQVMQAINMNLTENILFFKVKEVIEGTYNNYSSMYKAIQNGKKSEIDYLNVQLIKLGKEKKIPTPINIELLNQFYDKFPLER